MKQKSLFKVAEEFGVQYNRLKRLVEKGELSLIEGSSVKTLTDESYIKLRRAARELTHSFNLEDKEVLDQYGLKRSTVFKLVDLLGFKPSSNLLKEGSFLEEGHFEKLLSASKSINEPKGRFNPPFNDIELRMPLIQVRELLDSTNISIGSLQRDGFMYLRVRDLNNCLCSLLKGVDKGSRSNNRFYNRLSAYFNSNALGKNNTSLVVEEKGFKYLLDTLALEMMRECYLVNTELLTEMQLSKAIGVAATTVGLMRANGELDPILRVGNTNYYSRNDVAYIKKKYEVYKGVFNSVKSEYNEVNTYAAKQVLEMLRTKLGSWEHVPPGYLGAILSKSDFPKPVIIRRVERYIREEIDAFLDSLTEDIQLFGVRFYATSEILDLLNCSAIELNVLLQRNGFKEEFRFQKERYFAKDTYEKLYKMHNLKTEESKLYKTLRASGSYLPAKKVRDILDYTKYQFTYNFGKHAHYFPLINRSLVHVDVLRDYVKRKNIKIDLDGVLT